MQAKQEIKFLQIPLSKLIERCLVVVVQPYNWTSFKINCTNSKLCKLIHIVREISWFLMHTSISSVKYIKTCSFAAFRDWNSSPLTNLQRPPYQLTYQLFTYKSVKMNFLALSGCRYPEFFFAKTFLWQRMS